MRKVFSMLVTAAASGALVSCAAVSATQASQKIEVVNHHSAAIVSYRVQLAGGDTWSANLVQRPVRPYSNLQLGPIPRNAGSECRLATTITFVGGAELKEVINYCGARFVNVTGEAIWAETASN
jgi:hypothetical protein